MVDKTLNFILGDQPFKTLGASRTDAMVSAEKGAFELFTSEPIDPKSLLLELNLNLPSDIRALEVKEVDAQFNIIQTPKIKEYIYLFSFGKKNHPFSAPFMAYKETQLQIEAMMHAAKMFEGVHDFRQYCYRPKEGMVFDREIQHCSIVDNKRFTASFFPEKSYMLVVKGKGFMRHQIRLMMGALFFLGEGKLSLEDFEKSLSGEALPEGRTSMAPASGLILSNVDYDEY